MISTRLGFRVFAALAVALATVGASSPAPGQQAASAPLPSAQALQDGVQVRLRGRDAGATAPVDEGALRYYASRGEQAQVDAEIARLRALHPGWQPPVDLFGPVATVDEQPLWDLYDERDYDGVREAIAELQLDHPEWQPPRKLLDLIDENEVRAELQALEQAGRWQGLLDVATAHPGQIGCARIDNMWRVARAHAELGQEDQGVAVYARIIETCDQVEHRIATLQKAKAQVDQDRLGELFELERTRSKPKSAARRIAALQEVATDPKIPAVIQELFGAGIDLSMVEDAEAQVMILRHAVGAERLGWLYFDAERWRDAVRWFRRSQRWQPGAKTVEGLARAYAKLGKADEVEALAAAWPAELGPILGELRREWIGEAFARGDHAMLLRQTEGRTMSWARNLRGWAYLQLERPTEASQTFAEVMNDEEAAPAARREAAYGLARAQIAIGALGDAEAIVAAHDVSEEQRYEIRAEVLSQRAQQAFADGDHHSFLILMETRRGFAEPTREMLIQEAWARYHLGQKQTAKRMFEQLHRVYATKETQEGLRVVTRAIDRIGL